MSDSKKTQLLGKKRELEKKSEGEGEEEENETSKKKQKKLENEDIKDNKPSEKSQDDESSESSNSEPKQSLFGKNETGFSGGLFGDLNNPKKSTSLFENPKEGGSLFSNTGGSLFGNISKDNNSTSGGLFSGGLFDFSQVNKKKEDDDNGEEGGEEENNIGKSNSPKHEYNPENDFNDKKPDKDGYIKRYIKKVDNALLYDKLKRTFVSRGEGFIIIETQEKENEDKKKERFARILFRNSIGGIIFQGVMNNQIHKCISSEKKLKHICHFIFLSKEDEKSDLSLAQAKIPFTTLEEINKFSEKYNNTIKYLNNEIDEF